MTCIFNKKSVQNALWCSQSIRFAPSNSAMSCMIKHVSLKLHVTQTYCAVDMWLCSGRLERITGVQAISCNVTGFIVPLKLDQVGSYLWKIDRYYLHHHHWQKSNKQTNITTKYQLNHVMVFYNFENRRVINIRVFYVLLVFSGFQSLWCS